MIIVDNCWVCEAEINDIDPANLEDRFARYEPFHLDCTPDALDHILRQFIVESLDPYYDSDIGQDYDVLTWADIQRQEDE